MLFVPLSVFDVLFYSISELHNVKYSRFTYISL